MTVKLVWITPEADSVIGYCARVSNPANQANPDVSKLLAYCAKHGHWSVFEMASACIEIETTRDIGRQILRHRSFSFQEFSQRYAEADALGEAPARQARMQDTKNRQSSLDCADPMLALNWQTAQAQVRRAALDTYRWAIERGIAKEVARSVLPEGLTMSRMYMSGTLRSWITYLQQRLDASTQLEHRDIANAILGVLRTAAPVTMGAFYE